LNETLFGYLKIFKTMNQLNLH